MMKAIFIFFLIISTPLIGKTQSDNNLDSSVVYEKTAVIVATNTPKNNPSKTVEELPSYTQGTLEIQKFIIKHINYPSLAIELKQQGKVFVAFSISSSGEPIDIKILKTFNKECSKEVVRVIKLMKWIKTKEAQPIKIIIPIEFRLN